MNYKKYIITCGLFLIGGIVMAQLPKTDMYMVTIKNNGSKIDLTDPVYISGFNPDGYNNQPAFLNPRELFITSNRYDKNFTEFLKLNFSEEKYYRITETDSISEYSPTPNAPENSFSAVRVERDGVTQSLWLYPENHKGEGRRVLKDLSNIGYHHWISETEVVLFLVGDVMSMQIADIETGKSRQVIDNIGRCFRSDSDGNLLFVHKASEERWYLKKFNLETETARTFAITRPGSEDFEIIAGGILVMAEGNQIYGINLDGSGSWKLISDMSGYDITKITRMATSRNKLVFVDNPSN